MLPEIFCSANDCACKPATAVVNASKIPMTCSPLFSTERATGHDGRPCAAHPAASHVPLVLLFYFNNLRGLASALPGTDMPGSRQKLPSRQDAPVSGPGCGRQGRKRL